SIFFYFHNMAAPAPTYFPESQDNKILKPQTSSIDDQGRPYLLSSKEAERPNDNESSLSSPSGEMMLEDKTKVSVQADRGEVIQLENRMELRDNVHIETSSGYVLKGSQMTLSFKNNDATSTHPVTGTGPAGDVDSEEGVHITREGDIHFKGLAHLVIRPQEEKEIS
ncbi:MAG: LPS export ABC transporter periplasmic protein LptC, partial [bacterium]|nr:LPS export ABC transporter periplasmic protein LptC [bacterium]